MCGRFTVTSPAEVLAEELGLDEWPAGMAARFNVAPSQPVPVVTGWARRTLELFRWGLIPQWATDPSIGYRMINARCETLMERSSFRDCFERRRCLVVADGFFEWKRPGGGVRVPMYVRLRSRRPFAFAGLWEGWLAPSGDFVRSCTIITTAANRLLAPIHDRMPVILGPEARAAWLDDTRDTEALSELLVPYPADELEAYSVSPLVNSPNNDSPDCIRPELPRGTLPLFPDDV